MLEISLHAPIMMKGRVSYNQMEVTAVKEDGYPTPFSFIQIDKGEWGDFIHIIYTKT